MTSDTRVRVRTDRILSGMDGQWSKMECSHVGPEFNFFFVKVPKHVLPLYRWAGVVGVVNSMDGVFVLLHGLKMEYGNVYCQKVYKFLL